MPEAYPASGTYLDSVTVALSIIAAQEGSAPAILWTTNAWGHSNLYSSPLVFSNSVTLGARATNANWNDSADAWYYYTITNAPPVVPPVTNAVRRATVRGKFIIRFSWE
jgi:hypothetical protein